MYYGFISKTILTFIILCFSTQLFSAVSFVAGVGQPAAGFPDGSAYQSVNFASMGPSGHVAFSGSADNTSAVWSGLPGQLKVIIQENESPVGFPSNVLFGSGSGSIPFVTKSGSVGFNATLKGAVDNGATGILVHIAGTTHGVIKDGDPAPGFPPGTTIGESVLLAFTDAGMLISTNAINLQEGIFRLGVLYFYDFNKLEMIPAIAENCQYDALLAPTSVSVNESGEVVFSTVLTDLVRDACPVDSGIFKWAGGNITILQAGNVSSGTQNMVPGINDTFFGPFLLSRLTSNDKGDVTFNVSLNRQDALGVGSSAWVKSGSNSPKLLALPGESLLNNSNDIIFDLGIGTILNTNLSDNGFSLVQVVTGSFGAFSSSLLIGEPREQPYTSLDQLGESHLTVIAQVNEQPPGFAATSFFSAFTGMAINRSGQYVFSATAEDAIDGSLSSTIWRGDSSNPSPELVVRSGMQVNLGNTSFLINEVSALGPGLAFSTSGGFITPFSDNGDILFSANITEQTTNRQAEGLFVITNGDIGSNNTNNEARIFSLAEQKFTDLFAPANPPDQTAEGFLFRFYPTTNTYIGIKAGEVFVLGAPFGPDVLNVGTIASVLELLESR